MPKYSKIVLSERPKTFIDDKTFRKETAELPSESSLKPEEVLVKVEWLSVDPGELQCAQSGFAGLMGNLYF